MPTWRNTSKTRIAAALAAVLLASAPAHAADADDLLEVEARILHFEDQRVSPPELHAWIADPRPQIRGRAALALGRIGLPADVPKLAPLLADPDPEVRRWAAFALGEIDDSTAGAPLAQLLSEKREPDSEVRALAVEALGKLHQGEEACRIALQDEAEAVRVSALYAAWKIPVHGVVPELLQLARHERTALREAAVYCLMRFLGAPASGRTPIPGGLDLTADERASIITALREAMRDPSPAVRMHATRGLRNDGSASTTQLLLNAIEDEDWRVRVEVLRSLGAAIPDSAGGPRRVPLPPVFARLSDSNPNVGVTAIEAMVQLTGVRPMEGKLVDLRLAELLSHPQPRFRETAFLSLVGRMRNIEMDDATRASLEAKIDTLLADRNWAVRAATVSGLDLLSRDAQRRILELLRNDESRVSKLALSPYLRMRAEEGAGSFFERLQPELGVYLEAGDPILRYSAWDAIRELIEAAREGAASESGAPPALSVPTLQETDWTELEAMLEAANGAIADDPKFVEVRQALVAVAALEPERPRLAEFLRARCDDPNYLVRRDAVGALRDAGLEPPRAPEPVETGKALDDYRAILEWARRDWKAEIETDGGTLELRLFTRVAPLTCWNFARLCERSFYDGGNWHRVVPDFVLQDGCPRGDGWGGPPWQIRCEINRHRYERGALGMALSGKDTGGSQFFLTHSDQPHLDGGYTVFGSLIGGQEIADQIVQGAPIHRIRVVEG